MTGVRGGRPHWVNWYPIQERIIDGASGNDEDVLLVDVGGGRGHDLDTFIRRFPDAKGRFILEDLPAVIDDYQAINPRIDPVKHDFFTRQPVHGERPPVTWPGLSPDCSLFCGSWELTAINYRSARLLPPSCPA